MIMMKLYGKSYLYIPRCSKPFWDVFPLSHKKTPHCCQQTNVLLVTMFIPIKKPEVLSAEQDCNLDVAYVLSGRDVVFMYKCPVKLPGVICLLRY